jgi:hypothetical protein
VDDVQAGQFLEADGAAMRRGMGGRDPQSGSNSPRIITSSGAGTASVLVVQKRGAHYLFQAPDLLAQGGLGDEDPLRGGREAARIGDRHEVAQMP